MSLVLRVSGGRIIDYHVMSAEVGRQLRCCSEEGGSDFDYCVVPKRCHPHALNTVRAVAPGGCPVELQGGIRF